MFMGTYNIDNFIWEVMHIIWEASNQIFKTDWMIQHINNGLCHKDCHQKSYFSAGQ